MKDKICLFCKNFYFREGHPGYSDMTPGWDSSFGCDFGIWDKDDVSDEETYRECQLTAQTCEKFNPVKEIDLTLNGSK